MVTGDEEPQSEAELHEVIIRILQGIPRFFVGRESRDASVGSRMAADIAVTRSLRLTLTMRARTTWTARRNSLGPCTN